MKIINNHIKSDIITGKGKEKCPKYLNIPLFFMMTATAILLCSASVDASTTCIDELTCTDWDYECVDVLGYAPFECCIACSTPSPTLTTTPTLTPTPISTQTTVPSQTVQCVGSQSGCENYYHGYSCVWVGNDGWDDIFECTLS